LESGRRSALLCNERRRQRMMNVLFYRRHFLDIPAFPLHPLWSALGDYPAIDAKRR
jgi:hypothetical protein